MALDGNGHVIISYVLRTSRIKGELPFHGLTLSIELLLVGTKTEKAETSHRQLLRVNVTQKCTAVYGCSGWTPYCGTMRRLQEGVRNLERV